MVAPPHGVGRLSLLGRIGLALACLTPLAAATELEILNVTQTGTGAGKQVQIEFRYRDADSAALTIALEASADNGSTWDIPVHTLTGATAVAATPEWQTATITWAAGIDWPGQYSTEMKVRLIADDHHTPTALYLVVDVSTGPDAATYGVTELDAAPADLLSNPEYKTTKIVLRRLEPGTFTMGSPEGEVGRQADETQHEVTLTYAFYIGVFEVTQKQWERVTGITQTWGHTGETLPLDQPSWGAVRGGTWPGGGPAVDAFMGRLQAKAGLGFDLPTEAQWEYACRAGTTAALNNGENLTSTEQDPAMDAVGWYGHNSGGTLHEGGGKPPNAWGLYDMHGNVSEWCLDWYGEYPGPAQDPVGAASGPTDLDRVFRGGNWFVNARLCRSADREVMSYSSGTVGFRLALPTGQP
jgi:formylglycine-generating enzyme required for sulfatase activity